MDMLLLFSRSFRKMVIQTQNSRRNCGTLNDSLCGLMCKIICSKVFGMNIEFERR